MNFDDVINLRRSIRKYQNKEIKEEYIKKIIECGIKAPSAHNRQPWKVKVLTGELKDEVCKLLSLKKEINPSIENTANVIREAPVLLAIFYDKKDGERDNDILSLGAFIENMHLKATELGLGSLWIANTNYIKKEISEILNINLECISTLAVGYKNQNPESRPRKDKDSIILK